MRRIVASPSASAFRRQIARCPVAARPRGDAQHLDRDRRLHRRGGRNRARRSSRPRARSGGHDVDAGHAGELVHQAVGPAGEPTRVGLRSRGPARIGQAEDSVTESDFVPPSASLATARILDRPFGRSTVNRAKPAARRRGRARARPYVEGDPLGAGRDADMMRPNDASSRPRRQDGRRVVLRQRPGRFVGDGQGAITSPAS